MPPYLYWPSSTAKIVFDRRSAFKNGVLEEDILEVLSLHPSEVDRHRGRPSEFDDVFSGGKRIACPTMAIAMVSEGYWLEIGFRRDFRKPGEVCRVFHARYL